MIDHNLLKFNKDLALKMLWEEYFDFVTSFNDVDKKHNVNTIFFHNLGSFDGFFLYKALLMFTDPDKVNTIIDDANKFITITYTSPKGNYVFKDSYRIFPP